MYPCCLIELFRSDAFRCATTRSAAIIAGGEAPLLTNAARSGASPEEDPQGFPDEAGRAAPAQPCLVLLVRALPLTGRAGVGVDTSCALPPISLTSALGEDVASVVPDWEPSSNAHQPHTPSTVATRLPQRGRRQDSDHVVQVAGFRFASPTRNGIALSAGAVPASDGHRLSPFSGCIRSTTLSSHIQEVAKWRSDSSFRMSLVARPHPLLGRG